MIGILLSKLTAIVSPACAPDFRRAEYTVTPAQSIGAAASEGRDSGMGVT